MKHVVRWARRIGVSGVVTITAAVVLAHAVQASADSWEWHWRSGGGGAVREVVRFCLDIFWWLRVAR